MCRVSLPATSESCIGAHARHVVQFRSAQNAHKISVISSLKFGGPNDGLQGVQNEV